MLRKIKNLFHFFKALAASIIYKFPSKNLIVIGITGTDGKTTTSHLVGSILREAGYKTAIISTLGAFLDDKQIETGFHVTTPDPFSLQKLLRKITDSGFTHVVLEATSHGLDQHRLLGINFTIGILTNITHEHLDYHLTYEKYLEAKAKLFKKTKLAVLNRDDQSYEKIAKKVNGMIVTYAIDNQADFSSKEIKLSLRGISFKISLNGKKYEVQSGLTGEYNIYNILAAISVASYFQISPEIILQALKNFNPISGRMEEIKEGQGFKVFVDFAHTPNAMQNVLKNLDQYKGKKGKIISVFGCAGERDKEKRPLMGEVSARLAYATFITAEDPRFEDVNLISKQIAQGCLKAGIKEVWPESLPDVRDKFFVRINDRQEAIKQALKMASNGDVVGVFGKGHEQSMNINDQEVPWSDQKITKDLLRLK